MGQFENFKSEQELVGRIEQLRADGVHDGDITIFSKEALEGTSLNYTNVNFKNADGSAWDKFVSLFTSEAPEERALADFELNESQKEDYITSLQAGDILLHVNDVALGESDKMGSDEEETSRYDSDDGNVGGEPHEKQGTGEEKNPGVANTAVETESMGSTLSAGEALEDDNDTAPSTRAELDRNYEAREVDSISDLDEKSDTGTRVADAEPNLEYGGAEDPKDENFEGTMRAEDRDTGDEEENTGTRVTDVEPNLEYGGAEDPEDENFEGTMRAEDRDTGDEAPERVDVSNYGYGDDENRNPAESSSDEEDIEKRKSDLDKQYYNKPSDIHKNEPDRHNLNI